LTVSFRRAAFPRSWVAPPFFFAGGPPFFFFSFSSVPTCGPPRRRRGTGFPLCPARTRAGGRSPPYLRSELVTFFAFSLADCDFILESFQSVAPSALDFFFFLFYRAFYFSPLGNYLRGTDLPYSVVFPFFRFLCVRVLSFFHLVGLSSSQCFYLNGDFF